MKRNTLLMSIVGGVVVVALLAVVLYPLFAPPKIIDITNTSVVAQYPELKKIPTTIKQIKEAKENAGEILVNGSFTVDNKKISYTDGYFFCGSTLAQKFLYQEYRGQGIGAWSSTIILDCSSYYWIYVSADSGPELYGPFIK